MNHEVRGLYAGKIEGPIKTEIEGFRGLQRLSSYVTVKGKAKRDEAGNLTIIASNLFIKS